MSGQLVSSDGHVYYSVTVDSLHILHNSFADVSNGKETSNKVERRRCFVTDIFIHFSMS